LARRYPDKPPPRQRLYRQIKKLADQLRQLGVFNLLLSDGAALFCYCSTKLHYITRRAPFGHAQLSDVDVDIDFSRETTPNDVVTIVATLPLTTNEQWTALEPGQACLFQQGELVQF
jgi:glutamine amidotransferase